eukprot:Amastigsp_a175074_5.p2 type:complete len:156 gc:universal Amastigsp_a175074_5:379-846(+)
MRPSLAFHRLVLARRALAVSLPPRPQHPHARPHLPNARARRDPLLRRPARPLRGYLKGDHLERVHALCREAHPRGRPRRGPRRKFAHPAPDPGVPLRGRARRLRARDLALQKALAQLQVAAVQGRRSAHGRRRRAAHHPQAHGVCRAPDRLTVEP